MCSLVCLVFFGQATGTSWKNVQFGKMMHWPFKKRGARWRRVRSKRSPPAESVHSKYIIDLAIMFCCVLLRDCLAMQLCTRECCALVVVCNSWGRAPGLSNISVFFVCKSHLKSIIPVYSNTQSFVKNLIILYLGFKRIYILSFQKKLTLFFLFLTFSQDLWILQNMMLTLAYLTYIHL